MRLCNTQCCGMKELDTVGGKDLTAQQALDAFLLGVPRFTDYAADRSGRLQKPQLNFALVTFTGVTVRHRADQFTNRKDNYGKAFADLVTKEGLGEVFAGPEAENPNTTNTIQCWVWRINRDAVIKRTQQVIDAKRLLLDRMQPKIQEKPRDVGRAETGRVGTVGGGVPGAVEYVFSNEPGAIVPVISRADTQRSDVARSGNSANRGLFRDYNRRQDTSNGTAADAPTPPEQRPQG